MTTITIKTGLDQNLICETPESALESLLDHLGYVLMTPVNNKNILERLQKHQTNNQQRSIDSYDNIRS